MSVHQLPDGRWICKFSPGTIEDQPKKNKIYFGRGPAAENAARQRDAEICARSVARKTTSPSFADLADRYMLDREITATASTLQSLRYKMFRVLIPALGGLQTHELNHQALDKFVALRKKSGVKNRTIRGDILYVRAVVSFALKKHLIASHHVAGYELPRDDSARIKPPNKAEFEAIINHAAPHVRRAMWTAYYTGCRPGPVELYGLAWKDIDFFNNVITITSAQKGGIASREIPIAPRFRIMLDEWLAEDQATGLPIHYIIHYHGGKVSDIRTGWNAAMRRAGITRRIRRYDLRHMTASELLAAGVDIKTVSEILGNTPEQCMKAYLHVRSPAKQSAVGLL